MKTRLFIILFALVLVSCKLSHDTATNKEVVKTETLKPASIPADSAYMRALLECDSAGNVIMKAYDELKSKRTESEMSLVNNEIVYIIRVQHDTVYVPVIDSYQSSQAIETPKPIVIKMPMKWYEKILLLSGIVFWAIVFLFIGAKFLKK